MKIVLVNSRLPCVWASVGKLNKNSSQKCIYVAFALLFAIAPSKAADSGAQLAAKPDDKTVMICASEPAPTGSHLGAHKDCKTKAEWDAMNASTRDLLNETGRKALEFNAQVH